jgi:predicted DNA-binding transcriptional regulator YafY
MAAVKKRAKAAGATLPRPSAPRPTIARPLDTATTAADQLRRLLLALPLLGDGKEHALDTIARKVGTTPDTMMDDLQALVLRVHDEPGGFVEGLRLGFGRTTVWVESNLFKRPMGLTRLELQALEVGLAVLRVERTPDEHRALERARSHVRGAISGEKRRDAQVMAELRARAARTGAPLDDHGLTTWAGDLGVHARLPVLGVLEAALRGARTLRLEYRKPSADQPQRRTVQPYRLVYVRGAWYLAGYCTDARAVRVFRADRIEQATLLSATFRVPADFSLEALMHDDRMFSLEDPGRLVVRYGPKIARWIRDREEGEVLPDGSFVVRHPLGDEDWAVRHVLQYGPDAEVLEPASVRAAVVRALRGMLR